MQVSADLNARYFEHQGTRVAFDHRSRIPLEDDHSLTCNLRLSAEQDSALLLFQSLQLAQCEIIDKLFTLEVFRSRFTLRVDYQSLRLTGAWCLDERNSDLTQAVRVDRTISVSDKIRGAQIRFFKDELRTPAIPCFLHVKLTVRDPLRMRVADRFEPVEDKAVISTGRPESNRRRF